MAIKHGISKAIKIIVAPGPTNTIYVPATPRYKKIMSPAQDNTLNTLRANLFERTNPVPKTKLTAAKTPIIIG